MTIKLTYIHFIGTNKVFVEKNHAVHNIHILAWGPYARGAPGNYPACPCAKKALNIMNILCEYWNLQIRRGV
jgi:hypothetical protein